MNRLKSPITIEAAFNSYTLMEILGEGGAGKVYGGVDASNRAVAVKILTNQTEEKRKRFRNEIKFLFETSHKNLVKVADWGISNTPSVKAPYYVMDKFECSLRRSIQNGIPADVAFGIFLDALDGVEAAHLLGVTHRDLKPENILINTAKNEVAIADFGIAHFTSDIASTIIETAPTSRLANFQYAAPEQRRAQGRVGRPADIYALGLILHELFTKVVPQGNNYEKIATAAPQHAYLDNAVEQMLRHDPDQRPQSIADVKFLLQKNRNEAISIQKLDTITKTVVQEGEVTDPLALAPPILQGAYYDGTHLHLTLDRPVHSKWVSALNKMGSYGFTHEAPPHNFRFDGNKVSVSVSDQAAQLAINHFKSWLPKATAVLKMELEQEARQIAKIREAELRKMKAIEQTKLRVNSQLRI